jgi:hypothetical protein
MQGDGRAEEAAPALDLESELARSLQGFEVLERELEIRAEGRDVRAELAGIDGLGRLWIVARAPDDADRALLDGLALLAFARANGAVLGERAEEACVALVCAAGADELARRAAVAPGLQVLALERWRAGGQERWRLAPRGSGAAAPATIEQFLGELDPGTRALAELCLERMQRVDAALELRTAPGWIAWHGDRRALGLLSLRERELVARSGRDAPGVALRTPADVEAWLAQVLELRLGAPGPPDDLPPLPAVDPVPQRPGVLLSAEELAAFAD